MSSSPIERISKELLEQTLSASANVYVIKDLLDRGADPNIEKVSSSTPQTPIINAALMNRPDIIDLLISYGADINKSNYHNATALIVAVEFAHIDAIGALLQHGPDPFIAVHGEHTALDKAEENVNFPDELLLVGVTEGDLEDIYNVILQYSNEYYMAQRMQTQRRAALKGKQTRKKGKKKAVQTRTLLQGSRKKPYQNVAQTVLGDVDLGSKIISKHWGAKTTAGGRKKKY